MLEFWKIYLFCSSVLSNFDPHFPCIKVNSCRYKVGFESHKNIRCDTYAWHTKFIRDSLHGTKKKINTKRCKKCRHNAVWEVNMLHIMHTKEMSERKICSDTLLVFATLHCFCLIQYLTYIFLHFIQSSVQAIESGTLLQCMCFMYFYCNTAIVFDQRDTVLQIQSLYTCIPVI